MSSDLYLLNDIIKKSLALETERRAQAIKEQIAFLKASRAVETDQKKKNSLTIRIMGLNEQINKLNG
jgi:flagellar biosynthesis regulator FlaF